jgi:hypothetical protein
MAFSIKDMKGSLQSSSYLMASHYEMIVQPKGGGDSNLLRMRADSVSLPGVSFASVDQYKPFATGRTYNIPHSFTPQEISVSHLIDTNSDVLKSLIDWAAFIVDFKGETGSPFTANYFKEYVSDAPRKTITLIDTYPSTIDQVQMSWASSDEIARVNVSYQFVDYTIT